MEKEKNRISHKKAQEAQIFLSLLCLFAANPPSLRPTITSNYFMVRIDPDKITPLKSEAQSKEYLSKPAVGSRSPSSP